MQFCESIGDAINRGNRILEREKSKQEKKKNREGKKKACIQNAELSIHRHLAWQVWQVMNVERGKKISQQSNQQNLTRPEGGKKEEKKGRGEVGRCSEMITVIIIIIKKRQNKSAILNRFRPERVMGNNQEEKQKSRDD